MEIDRLKLMVNLSGKSQSAIAKELGISKQGLSHYLNGKRKINDIVIKGICEILDIPQKIFTQKEVHMVLKDNKLIIL